MDGKLRNMTALYLEGEQGLLCLLRRGSRVADGKYVGAAGGHFEPGELNDARACVLRELKEEMGLSPEDVSDLRLKYITLRLAKGEIRQNYYFFGRLTRQQTLRSAEGDLRWVTDREIPLLEMPVSAKQVLLHYIARGRDDRQLYAGVTEENGTEFVPLREFPG